MWTLAATFNGIAYVMTTLWKIMKRGRNDLPLKKLPSSRLQKASFGKVFAVQIAAYVVLVVLALIPGISYGNAEEPAIVSFTVVASVAMIALLAVFNPFRDGVAGHAISVIAGLLSVVCATTMMLGRAIFPAGLGDEDTFWMQEGWIAGVGGLLILLIVVSFGRQMARENRTHLIRSLSHNVVEGVAMIGSAGWCFLSTLLPIRSGENAASTDYGSTTAWAVAVIVALLLIIALDACSYWWNRDADPDPQSKNPWIGIALLPVMISGIVVGIASYATVMF